MNERDFDKGYKSGFQFGKEVANEEWLNKIKQAREDIENIGMGSYLEVIKEIECNDREVRMSKKFAIAILDKLIAESEV